MAGAHATDVGLKEFVESGPVKPEHFYVGTDLTLPDHAPPGGVVIKLLAVSVDPYMRGRMRDTKGYYRSSFTLNKPIDSGAIATVVHSDHPKFAAGDLVKGMLPWQKYQTLEGDAVKALTKVDNPHNFPISYFLGIMGMPGMTAWASLKKIAEPKQGETAFVSGAAGAVGLVVGQLLKVVYGCRVVGVAGSDDKVSFLIKEAGFDAAFNYKTTSIKDGLAKHCPDGIDIYFDNVGGETLEAAIDVCKLHARIVACGAVSQYDNDAASHYGIKNMFQTIMKRIKLQGFIVSDYYAEPEFVAAFPTEMGELISSGKVKVIEHVVHGLENAGVAFCEMMAGTNVGKTVVLVE